MSDKELRYGISALNTEYMEYAVDDELLIKDNGKIYYKRRDGQTVSYDTHDFAKDRLSAAMASALSRVGEPSIAQPDTDSVLYSKIDVAGLTNLLTPTQQVFSKDYTFAVSPNEPGMFIRVRGDSTTNGIMDFVRSYWMGKNPDAINTDPITIHVKITTAEDVFTTVTATGNIDELIFVRFTLEDVVEAKITGITFRYNDMYNAVPAAMREKLVRLNNLNSKFELDTIDVVNYLDNLDKATLNDTENKISTVFAIVKVETEITGEQLGVIVSKIQPDVPCIWAKILDN